MILFVISRSNASDRLYPMLVSVRLDELAITSVDGRAPLGLLAVKTLAEFDFTFRSSLTREQIQRMCYNWARSNRPQKARIDTGVGDPAQPRADGLGHGVLRTP